MNKEKWINEALDSTAGMQRAAAPAGLFTGITNRIGSSIDTSPVSAKRWIAAAILLLAVNLGSALYAVASRAEKTGNTASSSTPFSEIQAGTTYNY